MDFDVPQGGGAVYYFEVTPVKPVKKQVQTWPVVQTGIDGSISDVDTFNINFSGQSSKRQRMAETMTLVFTLAEDVRTEELWCFAECGAIYRAGDEDFLEEVQFSLSENNSILTAVIRCLADGEEQFEFYFLGLCRNPKTGVCKTYSSRDPGGSIRRNR